MGRIRTIKPEFWTSEQIVECSPTARLLFIGLWNFCDDYGAHPYSPKTIKMEVFPGDSFSIKQIESWLNELIINSLIKTYTIEDKRYLLITGWHHQKIDRPSRKYPEPTTFDDNSSNDRRMLDDHSPPEGKGKEGNSKGGESKRKTPLPPEFEISDDVRKWAAKNGYTNLGEHLESFKAKCSANGYQYIDWDAAFREAIRADWGRIRDRGGNGNGNKPTNANRRYGRDETIPEASLDALARAEADYERAKASAPRGPGRTSEGDDVPDFAMQ